DYLDSINTERKNLVAVISREAKKMINQKYEGATAAMPAVLVLGNPHGRPAFLWGRESGDGIKGSCRSDGVTNLVALMEKADATKKIFAEYGGHAFSGGFSIEADQ